MNFPQHPIKQTVKPQVDRTEALRYLGFSGQTVEPHLMDRFEALCQTCEEGLTPAFVWRACRVNAEASHWQGSSKVAHVVLEDPNFDLRGKGIAHHLEGAVGAVILACTLGFASERELRRHTALSATDGLMYGAAASSLIEQTAEAASAAIAEFAAEQGLYAGLRYSPGYGDLPLDLQPQLLNALDAGKKLGLSVTPANLLVPTKSITAILGLYTTPPRTEYTSPCNGCIVFDDCPFRQKGTTCHGFE